MLVPGGRGGGGAGGAGGGRQQALLLHVLDPRAAPAGTGSELPVAVGLETFVEPERRHAQAWPGPRHVLRTHAELLGERALLLRTGRPADHVTVTVGLAERPVGSVGAPRLGLVAQLHLFPRQKVQVQEGPHRAESPHSDGVGGGGGGRGDSVGREGAGVSWGKKRKKKGSGKLKQ